MATEHSLRRSGTFAIVGKNSSHLFYRVIFMAVAYGDVAFLFVSQRVEYSVKCILWASSMGFVSTVYLEPSVARVAEIPFLVESAAIELILRAT